MNQQLLMRFREKLASSLGRTKALPWEAILQAIIQALTGCFSRPATGVELKTADISEGSDNERWLRWNVIRELRAHGVRPTRETVNEAMAAITKARAEASNEDLDEVLNCCFTWDI